MSTPDGSKKVFFQLAQEVDSLEQRISKYTQMVEDLQSLPLPKDDFANQLGAWIDTQADQFIPRLASAMEHLVEQPNFDPQNVDIKLVDSESPTPVAEQMQAMMAYLLREQLKEAVRQAVETMEWPKKVGPPRSRRDQMVSGLQGKLESLQAQEAELLSAADTLLRRLGGGERTPEKPPAVVEEMGVAAASKVETLTPAASGTDPNLKEVQVRAGLEMLSRMTGGKDKIVDWTAKRKASVG
ncbi:MAG: hypothetical protein HQL51_03675 [Magnetococcales bacterium]|nr:hypothetical protein [Magnetococcales bacterium]